MMIYVQLQCYIILDVAYLVMTIKLVTYKIQ